MPSAPSPSAAPSRLVVQIGSAGRDELAPAAAELAALCTAADWRLETVSAADLVPRLDGPIPDLVVVLERWPDEFTRQEVEGLFGRWPLTRFVCIFGPWCDSAGRTRDLWPVAVRVPAVEARERLRRECAALAALTPPLPVTASRTETFAWWFLEPAALAPAGTVERGHQTRGGAVNVRVISPDPDFARALADLCRAWPHPAGLDSPVSDLTPPREVLLWDADAAAAGDREDPSLWEGALEGLRVGSGQRGVIALVGFPRLAHLITLERPNVRVVSKLAGVETLRRVIGELMRSSDA